MNVLQDNRLMRIDDFYTLTFSNRPILTKAWHFYTSIIKCLGKAGSIQAAVLY